MASYRKEQNPSLDLGDISLDGNRNMAFEFEYLVWLWVDDDDSSDFLRKKVKRYIGDNVDQYQWGLAGATERRLRRTLQ
jgi:hypothetical protein